jgi:hypothetical protein
MTFKIQNRLQILHGNKILVPGCEPTSAFSSTTLAENRDCKTTIVDLADALEAIPEATIVSWRNPLTRFFVLPDGPPPAMGDCDCKQTDWYQILRDIGVEVEVESDGCIQPWSSSSGQISKAFPLNNNHLGGIKGIF